MNCWGFHAIGKDEGEEREPEGLGLESDAEGVSGV